jgi:hypothetical protein
VVGLAAHEVGDLQREDAVEGVDLDLLFGPVVHRGERHHVGVLHLPERALDVGLGAVGGHDVDHRPVVAVGEQDAFAEDLVFEPVGGRGCRCARSAGGSRGCRRSAGGDDPVEPAGREDPVDLGLDGGGRLAGAATGEPGLQLGQLAAGFGQGLFEPGGLTLVEGLGVGDDRPAGDPQRGPRWCRGRSRPRSGRHRRSSKRSWPMASSSGWSEGGSEVTYPSPSASMWAWLSAEFWPES